MSEADLILLQSETPDDGIPRARGLVVTDASGHERVQLGAPTKRN
jgi:hypothetical protein